MPMSRKRSSGLDDHHRDVSGEIRHTGGNTLVGTLRKTYGSDFARGYRSDARLRTVLESTGTNSLSEYLEHSRRGKHLSISGGSSDVSSTIFSHTTVVFEPALKSLAKK
jgi:hypothetical protein